MTQWLKQSTAVTIKLGPFVDSTDGNTDETALTISQADVRLSKNGGDFAQKSDTTAATHDELGYYDVPLNTIDTNTLGSLLVAVHETGALPVWQNFMVVPANVWDSLFGADKLQVHADEITAGLITAAAIATGAVDADALAADAVTEITGGIWNAARSSYTTAGSFGQGVASVQGNVTGSVGSVTGAVGSVTGNVGGNVVGSVASVTGNVGGNVNGSVASVTGNVGGSVGSVTGAVGSVTGNVGGNVVGSVASVTAAVTVGTNNDKTGYALSAAGVDAILDEAVTEPSGVFAWGTATLRNIIGWLGAMHRNKMTQTATTTTLRNDADSANLGTSAVSNDGTTFTSGEWS